MQNADLTFGVVPGSNEPEFPLLALSLPELIGRELPPRSHIMAPWLPMQGLAMIYAPRGIGKTYVGLNVAYAIASGGEFLHWRVPKARSVLYLDGEMPAVVMKERLMSIMVMQKLPLAARFNIITPDIQPYGMPDLATKEGQRAIEKHLEGIDLIIVDNISTLCRTGRENEAEGWIPVQEWALQMRASGRSVLFIHHAGKGGGQRGTSKREDILDTVISLKRPVDYDPSDGSVFEIHFEKARTFFGDDAQPMQAELITDADGLQIWKIQTLEKSSYEKVIELMQEDGVRQHDVAKELNLHKSRVSRYVKRAKQEGKLP